MAVAPGDDCDHDKVDHRASSRRTAVTHLEVHDFQCAGCEVCARIIRHIPVIPAEE